MSRLLVACLSGLAFAAILPAVTSAQPELPNFKSGLWDSVMNLNGLEVKVQMCLDGPMAARDVALRSLSRGGGAADCSQTDVKKIPGGTDMEMTCTVRGKVTHTSIVMMGDFQTGYTTNMTVQPEGGPETKIATVSHWISQCPADMKPGQVVTKMDLGGIAAAVAAAQATGRRPAPAEAYAH